VILRRRPLELELKIGLLAGSTAAGTRKQSEGAMDELNYEPQSSAKKPDDRPWVILFLCCVLGVFGFVAVILWRLYHYM
jgi:hypothetical protein